MKLKKREIIELFSASIDNAFELYKSSKEIAFNSENKKFPSLGLAELALEELGKSYLCLSYYSRCESLTDWSDFWKDWKNHDLKARKAFCYEFFCLFRFEIDEDDDEKKLIFPTNRKQFSKEKEFAFYVDIDKGNRKIYKPEVEISNIECVRRITSLMGLFNSAFYLKDWITGNESENFKNALSDYAYKTMTENFYQQEAMNVLENMKNENDEYNSGLEKIKTLFEGRTENK